jgi:hypothetical protein
VRILQGRAARKVFESTDMTVILVNIYF